MSPFAKILVVLFTLTTLSGCAATGGFGELLQESIQEAGVTFNANLAVVNRACVVNARGARICAMDQEGSIRIH